MRVEQIMTRQVSSCSPDTSLAEAAQLMWDHDCGCLPVCTGNGASRVAGVITDRDICMAALFKAQPLYELRVADAMSRRLQAKQEITEMEVGDTLAAICQPSTTRPTA
jgi:CBS domain-containing protein